MEKKNLKWYEAPEMALVDVELQGALLQMSDPKAPTLPLGGEEQEI